MPYRAFWCPLNLFRTSAFNYASAISKCYQRRMSLRFLTRPQKSAPAAVELRHFVCDRLGGVDAQHGPRLRGCQHFAAQVLPVGVALAPTIGAAGGPSAPLYRQIKMDNRHFYWPQIDNNALLTVCRYHGFSMFTVSNTNCHTPRTTGIKVSFYLSWYRRHFYLYVLDITHSETTMPKNLIVLLTLMLNLPFANTGRDARVQLLLISTVHGSCAITELAAAEQVIGARHCDIPIYCCLRRYSDECLINEDMARAGSKARKNCFISAAPANYRGAVGAICVWLTAILRDRPPVRTARETSGRG